MHIPVEPLSDGEEALLSELLQASASASLPYARGVFTALACEPSLDDPALWLPWLVGTEVQDKATLDRLFALLMRDRYAIAECLQLGQAYAPHPEQQHAITQFCKGLVRASRDSGVWQQDTDALALLLPVAVLANYLKLESLERLQGATIDASDWQRTARQDLPTILLQVYAHFEPRRQQLKPLSSERVGRNEPCPCGSGKKFKRCCA